MIQHDSFGTDLSNTRVTDVLKYAGSVCNKAAMLVAVIKEMPCVINISNVALQIYCSVDRASWCICTIRTNRMHYLLSIYLNN